ncbi:putative serine/threonine-protein kinase SIS8 [Sesamum alatum]|uniref:non-specific serine/threonine protein kinase n=1 Tax=Sesamum alatum TaxID=300844 RepID=A0AAE1Y2D1_9LAMI|nr:putative serine/threonine-protein kinase SIS8 [Sesamum alatum]
MSKVKHLLRKLHIGDHHHHGRPPALDPSPQTTSSQPSTSSSPSSDLPQTTLSSENDSSSSSNFNFFEEEFQMQLALAISVSDPGQNCVDSETAQINAAKQISLGCSPSQNLSEFMSLRYWSSNVVNYDEKVIDGFYDVCGIDSNLGVQAKMPSLVELEAISALDNIGCEVVLVNRAVDAELRQLEERVCYMSMECHALDKALNTSFLVQKIAELIVERMGGPVSDVEDMFRKWRARNHELKIYLNTIILPLGSLDVGHSRQRALLFKVLADRINLPCKLVKGSYYTGTDDGAVNLIKLDDGSEYIIDLMGAPGTLIPAEVPSCHHQNVGLDAMSTATLVGSDKSSCTASEQGPRIRSFSPGLDETPKTSSSTPQPSAMSIISNREGRRIAEKSQTEQLEHFLPPRGAGEAALLAGKKKSSGRDSHTEDASSSATSAAKEPEFTGELPTMWLEKCASAPEDLFPNISSHDFREDKVLERNEHSLVPFTGLQLWNIAYNQKPSAEGLGTHLFKLETGGHKSSLDTPGEQIVLVKDRNNEANSNGSAAAGRELVDYSENTEAMLVPCSDQLDANKTHNVQMDPVLSGVAEILWEDLQIGERIGIGSYGEVYRGEWNGTEVAVKKFMNQDISGDALTQFKCEIEIMLRLRHPNVVLFMGAVTRPPNMSILTEFLPRGSLYKLLHRPNIQIDEKRRIKMALDVAKGMNYLHTSHPIIVHRDLKTPNLLVDKNWVVKVCDFGMSRLQHHTFLSSKSTAGTAEWMAPEVLRNEPSNEKSDVYSFGVILWELATLRVPWTEMNSMQVVGAVGFQGRHLDIPATVDPLVAEIISDCWNSVSVCKEQRTVSDVVAVAKSSFLDSKSQKSKSEQFEKLSGSKNNNNTPSPSETECPVPLDQQPINEYNSLSNSFPFSWASGDVVEFCSRLFATGACFSLFLGLPVSWFGSVGPTKSEPIGLLLAAASSGLFVVILAVVRMYLGWAYVGNRLLSATVEYEETGWYDGQIWVKTAEVLARDRLLGSFSVKPVLSRLKTTLVVLGTSLFVCIVLLVNSETTQKQAYTTPREEPGGRAVPGVYNDESARNFEPDAFCGESVAPP